MSEVFLQQGAYGGLKEFVRVVVVTHEVRVTGHQRQSVIRSMLDEKHKEVMESGSEPVTGNLLDYFDLRPERHEGKPPAHRDIQDRDAAICAIHRADHVEICRQ